MHDWQSRRTGMACSFRRDQGLDIREPGKIFLGAGVDCSVNNRADEFIFIAAETIIRIFLIAFGCGQSQRRTSNGASFRNGLSFGRYRSSAWQENYAGTR